MRVMKSISQSEITNAISSLEQPLQDVLMKYIYRGFEIPSETKSVDLLVWHEKVTKYIFFVPGEEGGGGGWK